MNCDRIAPIYEAIEKAMFGARLQKHRLAFLTVASGKRKALILGDGDGRFTQALVDYYPDLEIDSLDISAGMIEEAGKRVMTSEHNAKVRLIQGDALDFEFPESSYDLVFTHFFLDCLSTEQLATLFEHLSEALTPDADWIVSDFRQAQTGWRKLFTTAWLTVMYLFFRFATGLEAQSLPSYEAAMESAGFRKRQERVSMGGLIASEWWQR